MIGKETYREGIDFIFFSKRVTIVSTSHGRERDEIWVPRTSLRTWRQILLRDLRLQAENEKKKLVGEEIELKEKNYFQAQK